MEKTNINAFSLICFILSLLIGFGSLFSEYVTHQTAGILYAMLIVLIGILFNQK